MCDMSQLTKERMDDLAMDDLTWHSLTQDQLHVSFWWQPSHTKCSNKKYASFRIVDNFGSWSFDTLSNEVIPLFDVLHVLYHLLFDLMSLPAKRYDLQVETSYRFLLAIKHAISWFFWIIMPDKSRLNIHTCSNYQSKLWKKKWLNKRCSHPINFKAKMVNSLHSNGKHPWVTLLSILDCSQMAVLSLSSNHIYK